MKENPLLFSPESTPERKGKSLRVFAFKPHISVEDYNIVHIINVSNTTKGLCPLATKL